jgi:tripartite-type tricarboxylate transporter receptor subunit TctC
MRIMNIPKTASRLAIAVGVVSIVALTGCSTGGGGTAADESEKPVFKDGQLQPLSDGFPSSALTFVVVDEAGSDDGIYARTLAEAAKDISPVDIRILDRPEFGSTYGAWAALDWMGDQRGGDQGYLSAVVTLPGHTIDLLATPVGEELGASMDSMNTVLLSESVPYVIVTRKGAPWGTSFEDMLAYAKDNPGEVRYISRGPGSGPDLAMSNYADVAGVTYNTSVGGSHAEILTAVGAGAGDIAVTLPGAASPFMQDGTIELLTCSGSQNPCAATWGREAPNASSVVDMETDAWGTNRGMATVDGVPESHRLWLEALFKAAVDEDSFVDSRSAIPGVGLVKINKAEALAIQEKAYATAYLLLEKLGQLTPGATPPK